MTTTVYYTTETGDGEQRGLYRRVVPDDDTADILMERWQDEGWSDWPDLLRACGMGGNSEYVTITKAEAKTLGGASSVAVIAKLEKKKLTASPYASRTSSMPRAGG